MKTSLVVLTTITSLLFAVNSNAQPTNIQNDQTKIANPNNICSLFSQEYKLEEHNVDAPSPVRTLADQTNNNVEVSIAETELYHKLGLTQELDGSYGCMAKDPNNSNRKYTVFKVKKVGDVLVVSSFLENGEFLPGQEKATTDFFLEMIDFYTEIPSNYYNGIQRYFQEFYQRIADGRIPTSSDRTYPIDEPEKLVVIYHELNGELPGKAISLNIPLHQK
jgi:hypothetical protein